MPGFSSAWFIVYFIVCIFCCTCCYRGPRGRLAMSNEPPSLNKDVHFTSLHFTAYMYVFLLPEFTSFENVSDDFKIEIAEQFVQIKWKVLHSPKFVSLMMFF